MIVDSLTVSNDETIDTDVCIAGAGIAGITLARELIGAHCRVCLVECGGLKPDNVTQSFFWGESVGHPYYPLDTTRSCGMGGSGHRWNIDLQTGDFGVRLHPLAAIDFEKRDWVPNSGWPFNKTHLDPFYERAQQVCKVGPYSYDAADWQDPDRNPCLPFKNDRVQTTIFQFAGRKTFIDEHSQSVGCADNIKTLIHAHVTRIETNESADRVERLQIECLNKKRFWLTAKHFILALGAIETARLLLISNDRQTSGLGNQNDLVGRYFMEHPHLWSGRFIPANRRQVKLTGLYRLHWCKGTPIMGKLTINEDVQRSSKLLNYCVSIHPVVIGHRPNVTPDWQIVGWPLLDAKQPLERSSNSNLFRSAYHSAHGLMNRIYRSIHSLDVVFSLNHMAEQVPNSNSRVMLAEEKDSLGRRRTRLDWQMVPSDILSIVKAQEIIDQELRNSGLGRLVIDLKQDKPPSDLHGGWHHMGTTRMHDDHRKGVVDQNSKVYGLSNLFIAGPSVFPTCGYANPVLTIVALALRLADHIKADLEIKF